MKPLLLVLVSLALLDVNRAEGAKAYAWPKILLLGDSITEMASGPDAAPWAAMLSQRFKREADVVNRGAGGYTTRGYKLIFEEALQELDPQAVGVVLLLLGTNDCGHHVPLSEYESNLKDLVQSLQAFGVPKERVILLPPPPKYPRKDSTNTRVSAETEKYAQVALRVAKANSITSVDIHTIFKNDARGEKLFSDGVHFNKEGAKLFFESVLPAIEDKLERYEGHKELVHHFGPPS